MLKDSLEKLTKIKTGTKQKQFKFLKNLALELGVTQAKIVPANQIVVENRVVLKCRVVSKKYFKILMCPPYTLTVKNSEKF